MSLLHLAYVIARRRLLANWQLELVMLLGILLAVALLSSSVVFSDLLAEAALRRALNEATPEQANIWVRTFNDLDDPAVQGRASKYRTSVELVEQRINPQLDDWTAGYNQLYETSTFFFAGHPHLELDDQIRPRGKIQHMTGITQPGRAELLRGRWPGASPGSGPVEVALDQTGAELLELDTGDVMTVLPATGDKSPKTLDVVIVGVFDRTDPADAFWYGFDRDFSYQDDRWTIVPLFTSEEALLQRVGQVFAGMHTNTTWVFGLDRPAVQAGEVDDIHAALRQVRAEVITRLDNGSIAVKLDRVLWEYSEQLTLARIPLLLMVLLVTGILAYYLALVAGLVVRSRGTEIAMLRSRGSTPFQIGMLVLVEGLLLAIPAVVLGTLSSPLVAKTLGGWFFPVEADLGFGVSWRAILLGIGGALLAVGVLTVSTLIAARRGIVEHRQGGARPSTAPALHRYYLDILLLALIGIMWWQIQNRGSFLVTPTGSRELTIDFSLLLGPILGLLALGLLVLRFFPLLVALLARLTEPVGPAWLVQGLRRVSRDPIVPGSLVVLLMLATSLGVIGSAFSSTLDRSQRERAMYEAGADLWLQHNGNVVPKADLGLAAQLEDTGLAAAVSESRRVNARPLTEGFSTTRVEALAVDADTFHRVAWQRPDFFPANDSLQELLTAISGNETRFQTDGLPLPSDATALAVWAHPDRPESRLSLRARLKDGAGTYFDIVLGELQEEGWQRLEAPIQLPEPTSSQRRLGYGSRAALQPPVTLMSLQLNRRGSSGEPGAVFFDEILAVTPAGERPVSGADPAGGWHVVEDFIRPGLTSVDFSQSVTRQSGRQSVRFSWAPGGTGLQGIRHGQPEEPLPALVSPALLELTEVEVGDTLAVGISTFAVPVRIAAVADFFPTLDPREQPFIVTDLAAFIHYANRHNQRVVGGANELWISLPPGQDDSAAAVSDIEEALAQRGLRVQERRLSAEMVEERVNQPLTNASWGGLLVLMFLALVLASASGITLFSYLDTRERQTEFALLRTMGSSRGQVNGVVWFSLALVVVCGIGLGTWAGQQIGASILPILEIGEGGARVTPPMVLQTNWATLAVAYLVLASVTVATVLWLAWFTGRMEVQRVLRAGEAIK